jgi:hypothetical protein
MTKKIKDLAILDLANLPNALKTVYVDHNNVIVKVNRSKDLLKSAATCLMHMQTNQYGAKYAEILDADTEKRYAMIKRPIRGELKVEYDWDPEQTVYGVSVLLK